MWEPTIVGSDFERMGSLVGWGKAHRAERGYSHGPSCVQRVRPEPAIGPAKGRTGWAGLMTSFAHAVRPRRLTAWAKSRAVSAPCHPLRHATLPTLRRFVTTGPRVLTAMVSALLLSVLTFLPSLATEIAPQERRSGYADMSRESKAMQDDDTANPGMLAVLDGEALWNRKVGAADRACADCPGEATRSMGGVAAAIRLAPPQAARRSTPTSAPL